MKPLWTDYPIVQLGDRGGERAPVRVCVIVSYDGDKYAKVLVQGVHYPIEVKLGYLYKREGRFGEVPAITHVEACRLFDLKP